MKLSISTHVLLLALAFMTGAVRADTTLTYRMTGAECRPDVALWQFTSTHTRSEMESFGARNDVIYDNVEKLSIVIDRNKRSFHQAELDLDSAELTGDVLIAMRKNIQRRRGVDTRVRTEGCSLLPGDLLPGELPSCKGDDPLFDGTRISDGGRIRAHADAGIDTIDGIECLRRDVFRDGKRLRVDCATGIEALPLDAAETKLVERISRHMIAASTLMFEQEMPGIIDSALDRLVLVQRICYDQSGKESGRANLRIDHADIPDSQFEVPAGFNDNNPFSGLNK